MTFGQKLALNVAPLVMRFTLATVFIWAGSAKLFNVDTYAPEQAAHLANLGLVAAPASAAPATTTPDEQPEALPQDPLERGLAPETEETDDPATNEDDESVAATAASTHASGVVILAQSVDGPAYTAADYPDGVEARRLLSLALLIDARANPSEGPALWPAFLAGDTMIGLMPWLAAITELVGGVFIFLGLLTRLAALGLVGTMVSAMALTTIGPAWASGSGFLGFLPDPQFADASAWVGAWQPLLFQLTTGALALAVFFTGAGCVSMDRAIFGKKPSKPDADS